MLYIDKLNKDIADNVAKMVELKQELSNYVNRVNRYYTPKRISKAMAVVRVELNRLAELHSEIIKGMAADGYYTGHTIQITESITCKNFSLTAGSIGVCIGYDIVTGHEIVRFENGRTVSMDFWHTYYKHLD